MGALERDAHSAVLDGLRRGVPVVFGRLDDPGVARELAPYNHDDHWADRSIDGEWLSSVLTSGRHRMHRRGLAIDGARILGGLELEGAELAGTLRLTRCQLGGNRFRLCDARTRTIDLSGSACGGVDADRVHAEGGIDLRDIAVAGGMHVAGSRINGDLDGRGATLSNPTGYALFGLGAEVTGSIRLADGFTASGCVDLGGVTVGRNFRSPRGRFASDHSEALSLHSARVRGTVSLRETTVEGEVLFVNGSIGGDLSLRRSYLSNADGYSLRGSRLTVAGNVFMDGIRTVGTFRLAGATVGGSVRCETAAMCDSAMALDLEGATVGGAVVLTDGFSATGTVQLAGTTVGRNIDCDGSVFESFNSDAIDASHSRIDGAVLIGRGASVRGCVQLTGLEVKGGLDASGSHLEHPDGIVFRAPNAQVGGALRLSSYVAGNVCLVGAQVGGDVNLTGGTFIAPPRSLDAPPPNDRFAAPSYVAGVAINLLAAQVGGDLLMDNGFNAEGAVIVAGATIGNDLYCRGGTFTNPGHGALDVNGTHIVGSALFEDGFTADGQVSLYATSIGANLSCRRGTFRTIDDQPTIAAVGTRVTGELALGDAFTSNGTVLLTGATTSVLVDDSASWPERVDLDGFTYNKLSCPNVDRTWRARRRWLRRQITPSAQGYIQLAAVYRSSGDDNDARRLLIERHNALLNPPPHWQQHLPRGAHRVASKAWRWLLRLTIGYGYAPARALLVATPLVIAMALWIDHAAAQNMLTPTSDTTASAANNPPALPESSTCTPNYPCLQPLVYSLDTLIPLVEFGQRTRWTPDQSHDGDTWIDQGRWLAVATWVTSAIGWALATLVASSFTHLTRRD